MSSPRCHSSESFIDETIPLLQKHLGRVFRDIARSVKHLLISKRTHVPSPELPQEKLGTPSLGM